MEVLEKEEEKFALVSKFHTKEKFISPGTHFDTSELNVNLAGHEQYPKTGLNLLQNDVGTMPSHSSELVHGISMLEVASRRNDYDFKLMHKTIFVHNYTVLM